uniref:PGG domain-containing protein n=1 Tax=Chenopodium quinoa TaxID=63459 RepID=A0A803M2U0_CHEQI
MFFMIENKEDLGKKLLEKYWWMIDFANKDERTALDAARESNISWLTNLLKKPSLILQRKSFDWITKCEEDETHFVLNFIDYCKDLRQVCRELNDTPLHHIKLHSYEEYLNLLKKPSIAELKNTADYEGATPLHHRHGKTAMDLLDELCEENNEWDMMCKEMNIVPHLNTTYVNPETNLDQMRNTLSVVAALLATITFAAGFTLPGGLDDKSGNAILAKKAAFLVFILADAYAMCMSMLVLFCLIWSMVSEIKLSYILVDRSVLILMQGLYGTMVAFMTGIYTMIAHDSLWAVIIIILMCSFIVILANRTILHYILVKLLPAANKNLDKGLDEKDNSHLRSFAANIPLTRFVVKLHDYGASSAATIPLPRLMVQHHYHGLEK